MAEGATLLRGHKFYLARTLSRDRRKALLDLIQTHGGEVVASPTGATQLVECEMLDARQNWVAAAFVEDSVAFGALQDPTYYTGAVFTAGQTTAVEAARSLTRGRHKYTLEDDARMLHFVKTHHEINWQTMGPVPKSAWNLAEKQKVTTHSGSSMHEHFRKQLRSKTPKEQRAIMAQALAEARARSPQDEVDSDVEVVVPPSQSRASPAPSAAGLSNSLPNAERAVSPVIAGVNEEQTTNGEEVESDGRGQSHMNAILSRKGTPPRASGSSSPKTREEASDGTLPPGQAVLVASPERRERTRARNPLSPLSTSQRLQRADAAVEDAVPKQAAPHSSFAAPTPQQVNTSNASLRRASNTSAQASASPASPAVPSVPAPPPRATQPRSAASSTPALSSPQGTQPLSKKQQKQKLKRKTSGDAMESEESTSPLQRPEVGDSDVESNESNGRGDKGVFFESVWTNLLTDPSKRLLLQRYFSDNETQPQGISTNTALAVTYPNRKRQKREGEDRKASQTRGGADPAERGGMQMQSQASDAERATEHEADAIICQLQLETNQDMPSVVHALFYSSGDAETARAFLKGASPTGIWSPGDDLLLVNLMAEGVDRSAVDEAVARGDFAAMRVPRDTEEIVARIRFLL